FLARWIDADFAERCYPTLAILSWPLALALSQSVSARVLYGTGRLRWFSRAVVIEALANLLLSILLAGPLGIEGVALGTAIPNVLVNIAVMVHVCRNFGVRIGPYLWRAFVKPVLLGGLLALLWLLLAWQALPRTWMAILSIGSIGLTAFAFVA